MFESVSHIDGGCRCCNHRRHHDAKGHQRQRRRHHGRKRYLLRQEQIDQQRKRFEKDHFRTLRFHSRLLDHLLRYVGTYQITRIIKRKYPSGSFFEPFCFSRAKCERIHPFRT